MIQISKRQLKKKFKHAADFEICGNYNSQTAPAFESAIKAHVMNPEVQQIAGSYRGQLVTHYFDSMTNLNVIMDTAGNFVSGWKLNYAQIQAVTTTGELGGR